MKTIKERARGAAIRCIEWFYDKPPKYENGITDTIKYALLEQRDIDAERAVEAHCKICGGLEGYCDICPDPEKIRQLMKEDKI